ncbi:MAG: polyhydroxyalkanoic acid synthase [Chloroflexi bacterium]|uniref:Alpha/beta fold hydrolase n=1 Tax=Candidatus Chlorohelix allophototropha TaxID=3003348 RepID=A0A8T7M6C2_9CHLR|nr:polyhydroxyalkanoic acid synthase [Chloroflexota bacterium]WJW69582.1 alpha/beta fold hydrolase [Chloroflexota bacterium L227-S17]
MESSTDTTAIANTATPVTTPTTTATPDLNYANLDRLMHSYQAKLTMGMSPASMMLAYLDWLFHLANSPGKQAELITKTQRDTARLAMYASTAAIPAPGLKVPPIAQDSRFTASSWQVWPYNLMSQSFLMVEQWWQNATTNIPGVAQHSENVVSFTARQVLDTVSPSNYPTTNPEIVETTIKEKGRNLVRGANNFSEDLQRAMLKQNPPKSEKYVVGKTVAATPGKVIYRNRLIELIQYSPTTDMVQAEPILFVPAWIMKYYILDLKSDNSMVKYLVDKGHTVFMISWKNPTSEDRDISFDDYRTMGIMSAIEVISQVVPDRKIQAVGYCIGGTMLTITAAAMARDGDDRLKSLTLFTTQTDFTEAGDLMYFIDESQVDYLENIMWRQGYLDTGQMAGAFQMLRSNDLVWSKGVQDYLLGHREPLNDLMAWNADGTRLPYRMHSEYLRSMFLKNALFEGHFMVKGRPVSISDIRIPVYIIATAKDHVAPWKSVYKIMLPLDTDTTFVLTSGGHNAGIVSEPGHPRRSFQIAEHPSGSKYIDPDTWKASIPVQKGSWWLKWQEWLTLNSSGLVTPPVPGGSHYCFTPLADAPGTYVLQP